MSAAWTFVVAVAVCAGALAWVVQGWLARGLVQHRDTFTRRARVHLSEFFLFIDPRLLWTINLGLCISVGLTVLVLAGNVPLALAGAVAGLLLPMRLVAGLRRRRLRQFDAQLPDAVLALASALRAGSAASGALALIAAEAQAPLSQEFALMLREQRLGVPLDEALTNLHARMPSDACALTVSALRIASDTGGNLAETLERIAGTVRARLHMEGRIDALTAQGRMQAWVMGGLPLLLGVVLHRLEPRAMAQLWETPLGWATLAVVIAMDAAGLWLIRRIVRIDI